MADAVRHEKGSSVAAQVEYALQLQAADSLFAAAKQIPSDQPLAQGNVRILENRADGDGELAAAVFALAKPGASRLARHAIDARRVIGAAARARRAVWPKPFFEEQARRLIGREVG